MRTVLTLITVVALSGCAIGTHIVTGTQRPPIPVEQVKLYATPPAQYEVIGIVNARGSGQMQRHMNRAVAELKRQAAGLGANVLVGGSNRSVALQPLSVQGQVGLNIAAGVSSLDLHLAQ